ncbi:hypothetical protein D9M68_679990 [compost metagenome]
MIQATRRPHEAEDIKWQKSNQKADRPAIARIATKSLIERKAENLRKPVCQSSEIAEHHAANNDIMEMSNKEEAVVHLKINRGHCHEHSRHAANCKSHHEA